MGKLLLGTVVGFVLCTWALEVPSYKALGILAAKTTAALNDEGFRVSVPDFGQLAPAE